MRVRRNVGWGAQLHYLPHFKTVPEPMSSNESDNLLRTRDALNPDQLNFVSYNTRDDGRRQQNHDNPVICTCPARLSTARLALRLLMPISVSRGIAPLGRNAGGRAGATQPSCAHCCLLHLCSCGFISWAEGVSHSTSHICTLLVHRPPLVCCLTQVTPHGSTAPLPSPCNGGA